MLINDLASVACLLLLKIKVKQAQQVREKQAIFAKLSGLAQGYSLYMKNRK